MSDDSGVKSEVTLDPKFNYEPRNRDFVMRKSTLQTFMYCQRYFYYAFIRKMPPVEDTSSGTPAQLGTDFHAESSEFYTKVNLDVPMTYNYLRSLLPFDTQTDAWYDNFAAFELGRYNDIVMKKLDPALYFMPLANELYIEIPYQRVAGTIDRLWRLEDGRTMIQDIKTGNVVKNKTALRRELAFYCHLATEDHETMEKFGPFGVISAYSPRDNSFWIEDLTPRTLEAMYGWWELVDYETRSRNNTEQWLRNPFGFCENCGYSHPCWVEGETTLARQVPVTPDDEKTNTTTGWESKATKDEEWRR